MINHSFPNHVKCRELKTNKRSPREEQNLTAFTFLISEQGLIYTYHPKCNTVLKKKEKILHCLHLS